MTSRLMTFSHLAIHCFIVLLLITTVAIKILVSRFNPLRGRSSYEKRCRCEHRTGANRKISRGSAMRRMGHVARTSLLFLQTSRRLGTRLLDSLLGLPALPLLPLPPPSLFNRWWLSFPSILSRMWT